MSTETARHASARRAMVERQLRARGIRNPKILKAMGEVPREAFVPEHLREYAYHDTPLPIEEGQTISQPYIVAWMAEALDLSEGDRVLEIGAGSGYAAAVLSRVADEVYAVERHAALAELARNRCRELGYDNVHVLHGDGTLGWPEHAPYDAVVVAAGGPEVPEPLLEQLAPGGRLVIPVGPDPRLQELVRVRKTERGAIERENLGGVRFVPLVGAAGWEGEGKSASPSRRESSGEGNPGGESSAETSSGGGHPGNPGNPVSTTVLRVPAPSSDQGSTVQLLREVVDRFDDLDSADLGPLLERIGDSRLVLLGEATHGTSEFYRFRARLTRELIERRGFRVVAVEADWPDAAKIDRFVRHRHSEGRSAGPEEDVQAFTRFPTWMWRNREVRDLVHWLEEHNREREPEEKVSFHGLDLYSLHTSLSRVLDYLEEVDPEAAARARERYSCISPWSTDPVLYGRAAFSGRYADCEDEVVATLTELLESRLDYMEKDGERFLDAAANARVVADAERYYRAMYQGSTESWNQRDQHMFETLRSVLEFRGRTGEAKAVVWEHNSHLGDAAATEMGARGQINVGHLARKHFADEAFLLGFGTDHGTVAAASSWDGEMEIKDVRPSREGSYERLCHDTEVPAFMLHLKEPEREELRGELMDPRLERAIGVIYRPETELMSHYFQALLPQQFDEWVWFDETEAVTPLSGEETEGMPETYPFGL